MNDLFVPYDLAEKLQAVGFAVPCLGAYVPGYPENGVRSIWPDEYDNISREWLPAPLYWQVIVWFKARDLKIIESLSFGWNLWGRYESDYILLKECLTLDEAITFTLTQI